MNMVPVYAILGFFVFMFIYGLYLEIRGEKCPICEKQKMTYLGQDDWKCPKCGHYLWL